MNNSDHQEKTGLKMIVRKKKSTLDLQNHNKLLTLNETLMKEALKRRIRRTLAMHKLRNTKCRYAVLKQLIKNEKAMSHAELEKNLDLFDRVTIYRTINSFLEKGLVHRIMDSMGTMRYALCHAQCSEKEHRHEHVHFQCRKCGATECLSDYPIPPISLPEGYTHAESNLLIQGYCKICN